MGWHKKVSNLPGLFVCIELMAAQQNESCGIKNRRAGHSVSENVLPSLSPDVVVRGYAFPILNTFVPHDGHKP